MALFSLEEYEGAKEAFERTAVLEPTKRIHRTWVQMCQGKLGGESACACPPAEEVAGERR